MHQNALHFILKVYTYSDSTSMSPQNNESDCSWSSCSSSTSSYPPAAWTSLPIRRSGNPRHSRSSELPSSFLLKFFYISKIISLFQNYSPLCCLISLLTTCSIFYTQFYPLPTPQKLSLPLVRLLILPPQKVRCFFQKLLQNVQCRSNPIQNPPSRHLNWACFINASRRHLHPCTQLKRKPCNLHAILMGRRHTKLVDTLTSRTLG